LTNLKGITDTAERQRRFAAAVPRRRRILRRTLELLTNLEIPTVAAINGFAVGGGWFIALACDLRIAAEGAEFWMPEVDLGSPGPRAPEQWLTAHVGAARAKEIIFTCRHFKADELYAWGLLNRVVKKDELMAVAFELGRTLAAKNQSAIAKAKANINGFFLE
jgi:enoyl-CoA hydratase